MNIQDFSEEQRRAVLDLAILAMYADGKLTLKEDERVHRLLDAMGCTSDYDRGRHYDEAVGRVSRHAQSAESARQHATTLAQVFSTMEQRRRVHDLLGEIVTTDGHISLREGDLLSTVREALQQ